MIIRCKLKFLYCKRCGSRAILHTFQQIYFNQFYMKMKQNHKIVKKWFV
jgi:hypothetical protein